MQKIIENSYGYLVKNQKIPRSNEFPSVVCSQGRLIMRLLPAKAEAEFQAFLERI